MEKLFNTEGLIHDKIVKNLIKPLKNVEVKKIIDAGSGKTSASVLLKYFPNAEVDAIVYPGDNRKLKPLENSIGSHRLEIVEADICTACIRRKYDVCLAHLVLGEAHNFGNHFSDLFHQIMDIKAKYFIVVDIFDDPAVHFRYMEQYWKEKGFKIIKKKKFKNPNPEKYPKVKYDKYKLEFISKHYIGYLVERL